MADLSLSQFPSRDASIPHSANAVLPPPLTYRYNHLHHQASDQSPGCFQGARRRHKRTARSLRRIPKFKMPSWSSLRVFADKRSRIKDDRDRRVVQKNLERYPKGYPRVSSYIDSESGTTLFRRFGILHARSLLDKQAELTELEAQLDELDKKDAGTPGNTENRWRLGHSTTLNDGAMNEERKSLMGKIDEKMEVYDKLLLRDAQLRRLSRPTKRTHQNFLDYIYTEHPFSDADERFVYHQHDFVALEEHEESWLDDLMHRLMGHCRKPLLRDLFVTAEDQQKTSDRQIHYYSESRVGTVIKIIVAGVSTGLLWIPIYIFLSCNLSSKLMASISLIFALIFAAAVSVFTSARRQEVFGATAAYCAVLVVFIANIEQGSIQLKQLHS